MNFNLGDITGIGEITCVEVIADKLPNLSGTDKIVHLIRHGQGTHNLAAMMKYPEGNPCECPQNCIYKDPALVDASLTERGRMQAKAAGAHLASIPPAPEMAFVSPLTRTLQTATIALDSLPGFRSLPLKAVEALRERNGVHIADKRSSLEDLKDQFQRVDFSEIAPGPDPYFSDTTRETVEQIKQRALPFFWSLRNRTEKSFAVFSHSSFLRNTLTHAFTTPDPAVTRYFDTGEHRCVLLKFS